MGVFTPSTSLMTFYSLGIKQREKYKKVTDNVDDFELKVDSEITLLTKKIKVVARQKSVPHDSWDFLIDFLISISG